MTFQELHSIIDQYLLLADRQVVKLLCATVIANRIHELDPTWVFIVSNSSGGKSELLTAVSYANGMWEQDDLTPKTFISGAKGPAETSLLFRLPPDPVIVVKDLTLLLNKDPKESHAIFDQLRLIYDGKLIKSFGTGEDVKAQIKVGLLSGVTSAVEGLAPRMAALGERAIKYYMKQPDRLTVTRMAVRGKKDREMRVTMGNAFKAFLDNENIVLPKELPELDAELEDEVVRLSEMATSARSSIERKTYSRDNPILRRELKEMPIRMAKQLMNIGKALLVINGDGKITNLDKQILYQLALDSIPSSRKEVMEAATRYTQGVTLKGLSTTMKLPEESVKMYLDDLIALDIMVRTPGYGRELIYLLRSDYRDLMSKFQDIEMTDQVLGEEPAAAPVEAVPVISLEEQRLIEESGI
jgi:hypothetical protein